jgi:hypothetical protein
MPLIGGVVGVGIGVGLEKYPSGEPVNWLLIYKNMS